MILSNKFIKIQTNSKSITTHNYIFDRYLEFVNKSQFKTSTESDLDRYNIKKIASKCLLKFDTPINDYANITNADFDVSIYMQKYDVTGNGNQCNCTYIYNSSNYFDSATNPEIHLDINDYVGHKVTAIAFANNWYEQTGEEQYEYQPDILAFLDVRDYNISVVEDETIIITRSDDFASNMICDGIEFPMHLAPYFSYKTDYNLDIEVSPIYARLYSIGYGTSRGMMNEEYKLDDDEITITQNNNEFLFAIKTGERHTIYPRANLHPSNSKYPMKEYQYMEQYPNDNLHPSNSKYPMKANVKYIIFKYMLCCYNFSGQLVDLGETYTMNYYSPIIGLFTVKNKIERRN